jgi:hypothetical protein
MVHERAPWCGTGAAGRCAWRGRLGLRIVARRRTAVTAAPVLAQFEGDARVGRTSVVTKPNEMSAARVEELRAKLQPLLDRVAAETGLAVTMGKITYTGNNAVFAVEAAVRGVGGVVMGREAEAFLLNALQFGLEVTDLGRDFAHFDKWYRIVGMKPRSKSPVICQRIEPPSKFLTAFPAHVVRHYMEHGGFRTNPSPHGRLRVQIGVEPADEAGAESS